MKTWTGPTETESEFSIKDIHVRYFNNGKDENGRMNVSSNLIVSLEPSLQERKRGFDGSSFEKKRYPAKMELEFDELGKIIEALVSELNTGYSVLFKNDLLSEFYEARKVQKA
jgi:hypothetical protein